MNKLFLALIMSIALVSCVSCETVAEDDNTTNNGDDNDSGDDDSGGVVLPPDEFSGAAITYSPSFLSTQYFPVSIKYRTTPTGDERTGSARTLAGLIGFEADTTITTYQSRVNKYGSDTTKPQQTATGRFYVTKIDGRFWIVDPEGYIHYQKGMCAVTPADADIEDFSDRTIQYYDYLFSSFAAWWKHMQAGFEYMGFTGTGAFGKTHYTSLMAQNSANPDTPITVAPSFGFLATYKSAKGLSDPGGLSSNRFGLVLQDSWAEWCMSYVPTALSSYKGRSDVLGFFSDNEIDMSSMSTMILESFLSIESSTDKARIAAEEFMAEKGASTVTSDLNAEFAGELAELYYSGIAKALDSYDPDMLYLGTRLHGTPKNLQGVMEAAGRWCDIISINYYSAWSPDLTGDMYNWSIWAPDTPIMITEFYTKGADASFPSVDGETLNGNGAGFVVETQQNRGQCYQHFTLGLLESKQCVGWHWFSYMDNENVMTNKGIYKYNYQTYTEMEQYTKALNYSVYDLIDFFDGN